MHTATTARRRTARTRRIACVLVALAALGAGALGVSATPALAGGCPNEQLRSESNSTRLSECRAYEMVTPLYKEGFPVFNPTYSDEGAVAYFSVGSFAGSSNASPANLYLATRSAARWGTETESPPEDIYNYLSTGGDGTPSVDLRYSLWPSLSRRDVPGDQGGIYLRGPGGIFTRVGDSEPPPAILGASADLSHVVFFNGPGSTLREHVGIGNEGPPSVVNVDNTGQSLPGSCFDHISPDGRVVVFIGRSNQCASIAGQVWARVGGSVSVWVSESECTRTSGDPGGACNAAAPAEYAGAANDGSRVLFTTAQQLVNGDTDQASDLYECDIPPGTPAPVGTANPCASLTEVSGNVSGANVENVVNVSEDGSRVYFVAQGVLAANLGTNDAAAVAADNNLYVWEKDAAHPAGQTTFVAKLESNDISERQSTVDGRYLLFGTANKLLPSDTDEAVDVYRYDASTGALLRLSSDTNGSGGNEPGVEATVARNVGNRPRSAMTADGSTVVFETSEALSPADTDGVTDVYEWREGQVSLISHGGGEAIGITGSGEDILFRTRQPLTAGDSGTEEDIYDARVDGGFPVPISTPCSGEACQGAPALAPQPPGASASAAFNGPGSPLTSDTPPATQPKSKPQTAVQKLAKALKACKSKHNKKKRSACEKKARNTYRRGK